MRNWSMARVAVSRAVSKAKGEVSTHQVIVDGFGHADNGQSAFVEFMADAKGSIAANGDDGVNGLRFTEGNSLFSHRRIG